VYASTHTHAHSSSVVARSKLKKNIEDIYSCMDDTIAKNGFLYSRLVKILF
jgi:hypothetical protein